MVETGRESGELEGPLIRRFRFAAVERGLGCDPAGSMGMLLRHPSPS